MEFKRGYGIRSERIINKPTLFQRLRCFSRILKELVLKFLIKIHFSSLG